MQTAKMRRGDEVVIRKGRAPGTAAPERLTAAAASFKGDLDGCKGVVIGTEMKDGVETATVAATDFSRDGRATGLLDVPVSRLRNTGFRREGERTRTSARCVAACATQAARDTWDRIFGPKKSAAPSA